MRNLLLFSFVTLLLLLSNVSGYSQNQLSIQFGPTTYLDLTYNAGTFTFQPSTNVIKIVFSNGSRVYLSSLPNNMVEGLEIIDNIKYKLIFNISGYNQATKSGTISYTKSSSNSVYYITFLNGDLIDFNDPDIGSRPRPCCSRSEFKEWYKVMKDQKEYHPEWDVFCDIAGPVCAISDYLSAAILCCYFGGGPGGSIIPVEFVDFTMEN